MNWRQEKITIIYREIRTTDLQISTTPTKHCYLQISKIIKFVRVFEIFKILVHMPSNFKLHLKHLWDYLSSRWVWIWVKIISILMIWNLVQFWILDVAVCKDQSKYIIATYLLNRTLKDRENGTFLLRKQDNALRGPFIIGAGLRALDTKITSIRTINWATDLAGKNQNDRALIWEFRK